MAESTEKKIRKFLQVGTLECMILCVVLAIIVGVLFITIGFWKTLLITALILIGLFIGGVTNKKEFLRSKVNVDVTAKRTYNGMKREELEQKVRDTVNDAEEEVEEAAEELEDLQDEVEETAEAVQEGVEEAAEAVGSQVEEIKEEIADKADDITEAAEAVEEKVEDAFEEAAKKLEGEETK